MGKKEEKKKEERNTTVSVFLEGGRSRVKMTAPDWKYGPEPGGRRAARR